MASQANNIELPARVSPAVCIRNLDEDNDKLRGRLRTQLGGTLHDGKNAHHLIPLEWKHHPLVEAAARGGFDINDADHNGHLMIRRKHRGTPGHSDYNAALRALLDAMHAEAGAITDEDAAALLLRTSHTLRRTIDSSEHPLTDAPRPASQHFVQVCSWQLASPRVHFSELCLGRV